MNLGNIEEKHIKCFIIGRATPRQVLPIGTIIWYHGCIFKIDGYYPRSDRLEYKQICSNKGDYKVGFFNRSIHFLSSSEMHILKLPENMNVETIKLLYGVE